MTVWRTRSLLILIASLCAGCGKQPVAEKQMVPEKRSAVVDVVTQRSAVEAGQRAKASIEKVQAGRQQTFEEALGDAK